ncbi:Gp19/Gp15/Gp42 family protein [Blastococcus sp. CCUG 61487]|uniref:Gp19/Gp15/Gp42 family protein n=1 Tax=Blastococcus sp. CCUG 61487 TaxID=1840703 RepID=UPI0010BFE03E|nr:Gp19/Gp15/Gp42 family protein [Blastococcus sp. CCUG 61487]TKJ25225.1 hypothetical protein A6V29_04170 [Blastococcus sp. CCUG 61487]
MTEGAPAAFATAEDVIGRWRPFRNDTEKDRAIVRLGDASSLLRTLVPDIDARIQHEPELARTVTSTVVDAVVRFLQNPNGAKQLQETIGNRSYGMTFDGKPTGVFFTEGELAALRPGAGRSTSKLPALGTAFVSARPGWAPW